MKSPAPAGVRRRRPTAAPVAALLLLLAAGSDAYPHKHQRTEAFLAALHDGSEGTRWVQPGQQGPGGRSQMDQRSQPEPCWPFVFLAQARDLMFSSLPTQLAELQQQLLKAASSESRQRLQLRQVENPSAKAVKNSLKMSSQGMLPKWLSDAFGNVGAWIWGLAASMLLTVSIACIAQLYREFKDKSSKYRRKEDLSTFKTSWYDCFDDLPGFCFALNCPAIVFADNMSTIRAIHDSKRPVMEFWCAFWVLMGFALIAENTVYILLWPVSVAVLVWGRRKLREQFEMVDDWVSVMRDVFHFALCFHCALAQDARHIREASMFDHEAVFPKSHRRTYPH